MDWRSKARRALTCAPFALWACGGSAAVPGAIGGDTASTTTVVHVPTPDEVRNNTVISYVLAIREPSADALRFAFCPSYATDDEIVGMVNLLSEMDITERFREFELVEGPSEPVYTADITMGQWSGRIRIHVTNPGTPCIDSVEVDTPELVPYLAPHPPQ